DGEAPGVRRQQGRENPEERRLAAAVRAEEREDLAARHRKRDVRQRGARAEGTREGAGFDGGRRHVRGASVFSRQTRSRTRRMRIAGSHPIDAKKRERARPSVLSRAKRNDEARKRSVRTNAPNALAKPVAPTRDGRMLIGTSTAVQRSVCRAVRRPEGSMTGRILTPARAYSARWRQPNAKKCGSC